MWSSRLRKTVSRKDRPRHDWNLQQEGLRLNTVSRCLLGLGLGGSFLLCSSTGSNHCVELIQSSLPLYSKVRTPLITLLGWLWVISIFTLTQFVSPSMRWVRVVFGHGVDIDRLFRRYDSSKRILSKSQISCRRQDVHGTPPDRITI